MKKSQPDLFTALEPAISHDRIAAYWRPGESEGDVLARYYWNVCLSEALYPTLQTLEVTLRNNIHNALAQATGQLNWYDSTHPQFRLQQREQGTIADARAELTNEGKPPDPGRIVGKLTFGFWTSLFNVVYETGGNRGTRLWPQLLRTVFPLMPGQVPRRAPLAKRLTDVRTLRNRIFHHEPIWAWRGLSTQHAEILELIAWMNQDMHGTIVLFDRFPSMLTTGEADCRVKLQQIMV